MVFFTVSNNVEKQKAHTFFKEVWHLMCPPSHHHLHPQIGLWGEHTRTSLKREGALPPPSPECASLLQIAAELSVILANSMERVLS